MNHFRWLKANYQVVWHAYPVDQLANAELEELTAFCGHTTRRADLLQGTPADSTVVCVRDIKALGLVPRAAPQPPHRR